jgi:S1-C subfamily serine protease
MDAEEGPDQDGPAYSWLPPEDRLWRHPSEISASVRAGPSPKRHPKFDKMSLGIASAASVSGALLCTGLLVLTGNIGGSTTVVQPVERVAVPLAQSTSLAAPTTPRSSDVADIVERVRPAIVQLIVQNDQGTEDGSGVIFRSDGYALTNEHVVDNARSITAILATGHHDTARVVATDPETDIAVVKLDGTGWPTAVLGTTVGLRVGELAIAIGSPEGLAGGPSVTTGVISALGRNIDTTTGTTLLDMIQTDAPIAPGSSGGALIDNGGTVVAITTATSLSDTGAGIGFATPIDIAKNVADQLLSSGRANHVWLGVQGEDVDDELASQLGIQGGALVRDVSGGSPAGRAGIVAGDVITSIDGQRVTSMGALYVAMGYRWPNQHALIGYLHDGAQRSVTVTLSERPLNP